MQRFISCSLLLLLFAPVPCRGQEFSSKDLSQVHLQRVSLYFGWKFEYTSSLVTDDGEPLELENVLHLDAPTDRDSLVIRRLWVAHRENPGEPHLDDPLLLHRFVGWDGREFREYNRKYLFSNPSGINLSSGSISESDRASYSDNYFDTILTSGPHGVPQYIDVSGKVFDDHPAQFRVVGKGERLEVSTLKLEAREGAELISEAELSDTPEQLLLRLMVYHGSDTPVLEWEVGSLGRFEDTLYPASGRMDSESVGGIPAREYRFQVDNVSWGDRSAGEWLPEWPQGTVVSDQTDGAKQTVIQYPPETLARIDSGIDMMSASSFRSGRVIGLLVLCLCILGTLAYLFVRRRRRT